MKTIALFAAALLLAIPAGAQQIRSNYRSEGMTHIATDYETIKAGEIPMQARVEFVGYPNGATLYVLYINLVEKKATVAPKGVKMAVTLNNDKKINVEQIGIFTATAMRQDDGNFLNRLKYAVEPSEMEQMVKKSIKSIEIITGWNPDDYVQASFKENEFGELLKRHCEAILSAADKTIDLKASIESKAETTNTIFSDASPMIARGNTYAYYVMLSLNYYKNNNQEDVELDFAIGSDKDSFEIPLDTNVIFTLRDGSTITLTQKAKAENTVFLYPSIADIYRMRDVGIEKIRIENEGNSILEDSFPAPSADGPDNLDQIINQQIQELFRYSPR